MTLTEYTVINQFDANANYDLHVRPQFKKILQSLKKDENIRPQDFIKSHMGQFGNTKNQRDNC